VESGPVFLRQFLLAAGVSVLEAGQGRAGGQGLLGVGADVGQDLEQGIVAQGLGVVAVGLTGQELVDLLGEQRLGCMVDELGGAWVGQPLGQVGQEAEGLLQGAHAQEAGSRDDAAAVASDQELL
jgi:hypothetical protein